LKPYAAVRHVHYGAAAAIALRPKLAGRLNDISRLRLSTYAEALAYCGNRAPRSAIQAQFSLSYGLACALATGELVPDSYASQFLCNAEIRRLEERTELAEDTSLTRSGKRGATLVIELAGRKFEHAIECVAGDPAMPMSREEILRKFARYSKLSEARGAQFLDAAGERRFSEFSPL